MTAEPATGSARTPGATASGGAGIAVIGTAGRFPGARTVEELWTNLCDGTDVTTFLSDDELRDAGVPPEVIRRPDYVKAAFTLDAYDRFDAAFFGISPAEAEIMDPQHRVFLETCWHALEDAGYSPGGPPTIGVFGSASVCGYQWHTLRDHPLARNSRYGIDPDSLRLVFATAPDHLATRVAHRLDLTGPAMTLQSACSGSLLAVHEACLGLLAGECDLALAGGVSVRVPHRVGYFHEEGSVLSPDGRCRAFAADARGTVFGSGVGVVVLKPLERALADRDRIHAVVRGSAVTNDAASRAGYTAPGLHGQVRVVTEALDAAGVTADTVTYVEAHGTGTLLGDPLEVAALTRAFRRQTDRFGYCAIGSVKSNVGHLDAAAGVTSLIKAVMAVERGLIPASAHCARPNPRIGFPSTPFHVATRLTRWESDGPRRAGVTSLGVGGTNVHVILDAPPAGAPPAGAGPGRGTRPVHVLTVSARTAEALSTLAAATGAHLEGDPGVTLPDAALTLHLGRVHRSRRLAFVTRDGDGRTPLVLRPGDARTGTVGEAEPEIVVAFPGPGSPHLGMAGDIYRHEPVFRRHLDRCAELLAPVLGVDLRDAVGRRPDHPRRADVAQPALFAVEYALARLWRHWGIEPAVLIGHGVGEFVAACLAGVFTLSDALSLVAERGRLLRAPFEQAVAAVPRGTPRIPWVSTVTGTWIGPDEACDPAHWSKPPGSSSHLADGLAAVVRGPDAVLLEVGPGLTLSAAAVRARVVPPERAIPSLPHPDRPGADLDTLHGAVARLWLLGAPIDWARYHDEDGARRTRMPGYPFERTRHWYEPTTSADRAPLPAPAGPATDPPSLRRHLATVVAGVLGLDGVDPGDGFFDLGLDSVMAVQVAARSTAQGVPLRPEQIFRHPSVAALAAALAAPTAPVPTAPAPTAPAPTAPARRTTGAYSPADFPRADLDPQGLDGLVGEFGAS
ncbi:MAG: hypothetical protein QG622_2850 [Actinomycetota bacterium]|nr:hypothetical protein [Actinomycetota bacterium]